MVVVADDWRLRHFAVARERKLTLKRIVKLLDYFENFSGVSGHCITVKECRKLFDVGDDTARKFLNDCINTKLAFKRKDELNKSRFIYQFHVRWGV